MKNAQLLFFCFLSPLLLSAQDFPRILKHPDSARVERLSSLNSNFRETNLSVTPDGQHIFFMSDRGGMSWSQDYGTFKGRKRFDGDIWEAQKIKGIWQKPQPLSDKINTASGEDEPVLSPDGRFVYFQSWREGWERNGGPYYSAQLRGYEWQQVNGIGEGIAQFFRNEYAKNDGYATDGMCVSADGQYFLVAATANYNDNMDIFMSQKDSNGRWLYPQKHPISTKQDERTVFLAGDSRTLYFSSDGYGGFGGMDIFKTVLNPDGTFGEIINIGAPFNTDKDDYNFVITPSGEEAYFVREGDIHYAHLLYANPELKSKPTALINGFLIDDCRQKGIEATLFFYDKLNKNLITKVQSSAEDGQFIAVLPYLGREYVLVAEQGTRRVSQTINLLKESESTMLSLKLNLPCPESEWPPNKTPQSKEITLYFDFDSCRLNALEAKRLQEWLQELCSQPPTQLSINAHTDALGSDTYNQQLSECRASTVQAFFIGTEFRKLVVSHARSEKQPAQSNKDKIGRQKNRRVTIVATYTPLRIKD